MAYEPPAWRSNLIAQIARLPQTLRPTFVQRLLAPPSPSKNEIAWVGFMVLGRDASPGISELLRVIRRSKPGNKTREWAISCLGHMGGAALWAVAELKRDPDPLTSRRAADLERFLTLTVQEPPLRLPYERQ